MKGFWAIFSQCCHVWGMFSAACSGKLHFLCAWHSIILIPCMEGGNDQLDSTELNCWEMLPGTWCTQSRLHACTLARLLFSISVACFCLLIFSLLLPGSDHFFLRLFIALNANSIHRVLLPWQLKSFCQTKCRLSFYFPFFLFLSSFLCVEDWHESSGPLITIYNDLPCEIMFLFFFMYFGVSLWIGNILLCYVIFHCSTYTQIKAPTPKKTLK